MRWRSLLLSFSLGLLGANSFAQTTNPAATPAIDPDRSVSWKELPHNILEDQKTIWLFPVSVAHGRHILPTIGIIGVTSAFIATDPHSAPPFHTTNTFHDFNQVLSTNNSGALIAAVPAGIYAIGLLRKDSYAQRSALLAAEAFADSFLLDLPMKAIAARRQPVTYSGNGPYTDSFFKGSHNPFGEGGFFSGHAAGSMAVAAVFAHRYRHHKWVPFVAYGLAGAISFSRVTTSAHFPADAVVGSAIGFIIARYVVIPAR